MRFGRPFSHSRRRAPATIAGLVVLSLLAVACTNGSAPSPVPSRVAADLEPFAPSDVSDLIERLALAGIATYESPDGAPIVDPVEPVSVVRLLDWQARNMALEAWAGNGQPGSRLDAIGPPPPDGAPTTSQWLAAYVSGGAFVLAFIFGAVANKTNFCTMGAVSDWVNMGDT
ncbi:MAG: hypothetical protein WD770_04210, partial [Actinomycetota bacterium]